MSGWVGGLAAGLPHAKKHTNTNTHTNNKFFCYWVGGLPPLLSLHIVCGFGWVWVTLSFVLIALGMGGTMGMGRWCRRVAHRGSQIVGTSREAPWGWGVVVSNWDTRVGNF